MKIRTRTSKTSYRPEDAHSSRPLPGPPAPWARRGRRWGMLGLSGAQGCANCFSTSWAVSRRAARAHGGRYVDGARRCGRAGGRVGWGGGVRGPTELGLIVPPCGGVSTTVLTRFYPPRVVGGVLDFFAVVKKAPLSQAVI